MHTYLSWKQETHPNLTKKQITDKYNKGFVFTRRGKGSLDQTRSLRIDLRLFHLTSENRRILRKTEGIKLTKHTIPYKNYDWKIGKCAKDFYEKKFGKGTFSANMAKLCITNTESTNFTSLLIYKTENIDVGYVICYENEQILHYSYPFYDMTHPNKNIGIGMMTKAIEEAKKEGKTYIYLGSAQRKTDTYKLQFLGLEWFDQTYWNQDTKKLKTLLNNIQ